MPYGVTTAAAQLGAGSQPGYEEQERPPEVGEEYWAKQAAEELVGSLKEKERIYFAAVTRRGLASMWRIAWAQYYGTDPANPGDMATQTIQRTGPAGKFTRFRINEFRSLVRQQNVIALGERPAFQAMAINSDYRSLAQVEIADSAVTHFYKVAVGEARERQALEGDGVWGGAYGHVRWDYDGGDMVDVDQPIEGAPPDPMTGQQPTMPVPQKSGAPYCNVVYPWDVIQEPTAREMTWVIIRERTSKWEIAAKYPEYGEQITKASVLDEYALEFIYSQDVDTANSDDCIVKHFYHPRCAALPEGRYVGVCADEVLWDLPNPLPDGVPLVELSSSKYVCAAFGYCDGWDLIAVQEMIDQLCSDTASNLGTFGRQILFYDKGSDFDFDKLAEGLVAFGKTPGTQEPKAVNYAEMPESIQWFLEYLHERHQSISGLNSVARGDPKANIRTGTMAALFHSIAIEFQSARQAALDGFRERMANLILDMVRQNSEAPFLIEVAGEDERPYLKEFTAQSVSGVQRVRMVTANPMLRSQAGRLEIFNAIKDYPPEMHGAAIELIVSGNSKGFTEKTRSGELRIQWENEQLSKGIPCKVLATDNPYKHVPEHVAELEKMSEQLAEDEAIGEAFLQHILDHAIQYQGMDPIICAFLGVPPPPPVPNSPAGLLQMLTGMTQPPQQQGGQGPSGAPPNQAGGGAPPEDTSSPENPSGMDKSGLKTPSPAQPPSESAAQGQAVPNA